MNRLASGNEVLQAFSKALEVKFIISLRVKSDFRKEILSMKTAVNYSLILHTFKRKWYTVLT